MNMPHENKSEPCGLAPPLGLVAQAAESRKGNGTVAISSLLVPAALFPDWVLPPRLPSAFPAQVVLMELHDVDPVTGCPPTSPSNPPSPPSSPSQVALMELHDVGPAKLFDTAGIDELGELGEKKRRKTLSTLKVVVVGRS